MKLKNIFAVIALVLTTQLMQANYGDQTYYGRTVSHEGYGYKPGVNETTYNKPNTYPYSTEQSNAYPKYNYNNTDWSNQPIGSGYNSNYRHGGIITNPQTGRIINR